MWLATRPEMWATACLVNVLHQPQENRPTGTVPELVESKELFLRTNVGMSKQTVVRRKIAFKQTSLPNLKNFVRILLFDSNVMTLAVYLTHDLAERRYICRTLSRAPSCGRRFMRLSHNSTVKFPAHNPTPPSHTSAQTASRRINVHHGQPYGRRSEQNDNFIFQLFINRNYL